MTNREFTALCAEQSNALVTVYGSLVLSYISTSNLTMYICLAAAIVQLINYFLVTKKIDKARKEDGGEQPADTRQDS